MPSSNDVDGHDSCCVADLRVSTTIAKVIEARFDDERALVHGSKHVDARKSALLTRLADERRRFSEELKRLTGPIDRGTLGSWLPWELSDNLRARVLGRSTEAVAACRRSQHRTEARYAKALELPLPTALHAALVAQHSRVHHAARELAEIAR